MTANALAPIERIERSIRPEVCEGIPVADYGVAPQNALQMMEVARLLAVSAQAVPSAFRGQVGLCFAVAQQAARWRMDPWSVASKAYVVNDRVGYEAQLIIALINTRAGLAEPLDYDWTGDGNDLRCIVSGVLANGAQRSYESPPIVAITPKNSPLWKVDPKRQLAYWTARAWARLHAPEVMLGIDSADDLRDAAPPRDVTPRADPTNLLAKFRRPAEGESAAVVEHEPTISERARRAAEWTEDDETAAPGEEPAPANEGGGHVTEDGEVVGDVPDHDAAAGDDPPAEPREPTPEEVLKALGDALKAATSRKEVNDTSERFRELVTLLGVLDAATSLKLARLKEIAAAEKREGGR